jgi:hypothetical protein
MLLFLLISAILFFFVVYHIVQEKKRVEKLSSLAQSLGFTYSQTVSSDIQNEISGFKLFNQGHSKQYRNLLVEQKNDLKVVFFDYHYTTGSGKNRSSHNQTVAYFTSDQLRLPAFVLCPENLFHKIGALVGYDDIDFREYPEFSKKFLLKGPDEQAIRDYFTDSIVHFMENRTNYTIEASGERLIIYIKEKKLSLKNMEREIMECLNVYKVFRKK